MNDNYCCYHQLAAHKREGVDYKIQKKCRGSKVCVISPHGGDIEPGVSELVKAVAGKEFSWYLFEGIQAAGKNFRDLHITSSNFDEPRGIEFVSKHRVALALHGYKEDKAKTYFGGGYKKAREHIGQCLRERGFEVPLWSRTPLHIRGVDGKNICNRCANDSGGIQIEITKGQRKRFFADISRRNTTEVFERYVAALQRALRDIETWH